MNQEEFYQKIPEWISKPKDTWNHITLMAYFCHKYEQKNNVRFRLVRWSSDPGKGKESRDFAKLFKTLAPESYSGMAPKQKKIIKNEINIKIYNYINWMFDYKFRSGEKSVTGTRIFLLPAMINEFERMYSSFLAKNSRESKIKALLLWGKDNVPQVFDDHEVEDIGDLKMLKKYVEAYSLSDSSSESRFLQKAKELRIL